MQQLTITVWKIYLCTYVRVNSMCSKLEGIFKHIGLTTWTHAYICTEWHGILIQENRKMIRNTWNHAWCNVMPPRWCGKNWPIWRMFGHTPLTNWSNSLEGSWFREGTMHVWWRTGDSFLLRPSNFFLHLTCSNTTVMWKFGKFQGSFDLLKTFKWFSNHLMTVIQIWTTFTCNV